MVCSVLLRPTLFSALQRYGPACPRVIGLNSSTCATVLKAELRLCIRASFDGYDEDVNETDRK